MSCAHFNLFVLSIVFHLLDHKVQIKLTCEKLAESSLLAGLTNWYQRSCGRQTWIIERSRGPNIAVVQPKISHQLYEIRETEYGFIHNKQY